jgi:hypothetical protein
VPVIGIDLRKEKRSLEDLENLRIEGVNAIGAFTLDGMMVSGDSNPEVLMWESKELASIEKQSAILTEEFIVFSNHLSRPIEVCKYIAGVPFEISKSEDQ